jgi:hypothetical protein
MDEEVRVGDDTVDTGRISRRVIIKRAAATGAVAWTAPAIIGSLASPAGAQVTPAAGCFRYAFGWDCLGCMQRTDSSANFIFSAGTVPNRSCCPAEPGWNSLPNSDCIQMTTGIIATGGPNTCAASARTGFFVQFTVTCAGCFIADPGVTFVDPDPGPTGCGRIASSNDDVGGSVFYTSFRWNFTSTKYPRWFRMYVVCGGNLPGFSCSMGGAGSKDL